MSVPDDLEQLIAGDEVEHNLEVQEHCCPCRGASPCLRELDIFLGCKLHGLNDKVHTTSDANRPVVGPDMGGELLAEGVGDMACNDAAHSGGDADGPEFGGIVGVPEEAKNIGVGEVGGNFFRDGIATDQVE